MSVLLGPMDFSDIVILCSKLNSCYQHNLKCFDMPARFRRIIHQQAQISSFETFYSNPESLAIVLLSIYIELQPSSPWYNQTVAGKCSRYPTLQLRSCLIAALAQSCPLHTSSLIALYRKESAPPVF